MSATQEFHLLVERLGERSQAHSDVGVLPVPAGPSFLVADNGGLRILPAASHRPLESWGLEPIRRSSQFRLLFITPAQGLARLNGRRVPLVALLQDRDQLQLTDDLLLHVAVYQRPWLGSPPAHMVGQECPLCRVPFTTHTIAYCCPACQTFVHCEGPEANEPLECVKMCSECPTCHGPIVMSEGYAARPELIHE